MYAQKVESVASERLYSFHFTLSTFYDPGHKAALYCQAIMNQRQEKFRTGYRLALARLLMDRDKSRAAYELQKFVATRKASGYHPTHEIQQMLRKLDGVQPATDAAQCDFYRRMVEKYKV